MQYGFVAAVDSEHFGDYGQFVLVEFEYVGAFERVGYDSGGVEILAQVDVENFQRGLRNGIDKPEYRPPRNFGALGERAPTHGVGLRGDCGKFCVENDVVPRHVSADVVLRHARGIERHFNRARWEGVALNRRAAKPERGKFRKKRVTRSVRAHCAHRARSASALRCVVREIHGRAAHPPVVGENVPEKFAYSYHKMFAVCHNKKPAENLNDSGGLSRYFFWLRYFSEAESAPTACESLATAAAIFVVALTFVCLAAAKRDCAFRRSVRVFTPLAKPVRVA